MHLFSGQSQMTFCVCNPSSPMLCACWDTFLLTLAVNCEFYELPNPSCQIETNLPILFIYFLSTRCFYPQNCHPHFLWITLVYYIVKLSGENMPHYFLRCAQGFLHRPGNLVSAYHRIWLLFKLSFVIFCLMSKVLWSGECF